MDSVNQTISEELGLLNDASEGASVVEEKNPDMALSSKRWREAFGDSAGFQRFEAARKQSVKTSRKHCQLLDGSLRYVDKPFTRERPRAVSPELAAFYVELEMEVLR